jgi:hypothetical protein
MRWALLILGACLTLSTIGYTLDSWSTVVEPDARRRAFDQIAVGMTHGEVVDILGSKGQFRSFSGPGSIKPGSGPVVLTWRSEVRWEAADTTIDVQFENRIVTGVTRLPKEPPDDPAILWRSRLGLSVLALSGLALLFAGLRPRPKPGAAPSNAQSA